MLIMDEYGFQGAVRISCRGRDILEEHSDGPAMTYQEMRLEGLVPGPSVGLHLAKGMCGWG